MSLFSVVGPVPRSGGAFSVIGSSVSHQGKGFARKTSVTLGPVYCSQDEGSGLFYSPASWGAVLRTGLVTMGTRMGWATFTDHGEEGLGH